jgi:hypothetical protein
MSDEWSQQSESRPVDLDAIGDGDLVAVIVRDPASPDGYRIAGYVEGTTVPDGVEAAAAAPGPLGAPCSCGEVGLVYQGYSHQMPHVFRWPTLIYRCPACGRQISFMRLSAADARRALRVGMGVSDSPNGEP